MDHHLMQIHNTELQNIGSAFQFAAFPKSSPTNCADNRFKQNKTFHSITSFLLAVSFKLQ